ncbi:DsbE family thiol:disulfide interchange protein [Consotaella salsifontis]|uniref:Cytochrome c biogenesis protein CcmG, thiol:disulfide interchange protein DsbE n=1 Tax=Consotaella salsifontis TaxID=1365950 RepID=A0A1T4RYZ5_9HYPH|nr:DsbE family thiol:disulfide interchange protein [Consotaella salsifontis]SKA21234.1 cytochrome c biogenesis protein CcmG, thiol:disulfide interchange protein DsbE [Consotaella salsifontis]
MSETASGNDAGQAEAPRRRTGLWVALPLLFFFALAGVFLYQLSFGQDPREVPSVLIGKPAPRTVLPALAGIAAPGGQPVKGLDLPALLAEGKPVLVNVFASWCVPCRVEHPILLDLAKDQRFTLVAINYKDKPENARGFLDGLGNPFSAIGADEKGTSTIDWGVYGVPESFLVSPDGTIAWKQTGPFTPEVVKGPLEQALGKVLAGAK